jgi:hypothetical protein
VLVSVSRRTLIIQSKHRDLVYRTEEVHGEMTPRDDFYSAKKILRALVDPA